MAHDAFCVPAGSPPDPAPAPKHERVQQEPHTNEWALALAWGIALGLADLAVLVALVVLTIRLRPGPRVRRPAGLSESPGRANLGVCSTLCGPCSILCLRCPDGSPRGCWRLSPAPVLHWPS